MSASGVAEPSSSGRLTDLFQLQQAFFEGAANHLLAIEDEAHGLADEGVGAPHRPGHRSARWGRNKIKRDAIFFSKGSDEFDTDVRISCEVGNGHLIATA